MEKAIINFKADGQRLTGDPVNFASDTVKYIEAHFDLVNNWDFDVVRAVWTNGESQISTVLNNGVCDVPPEVLTKRRKVFVNLVGADIESGELIDRLTTCQIEALDICCKALIDGTETAPVTPSQFEQFVANVKADADRAEDARDEAEGFRNEAEEWADKAEQASTNAGYMFFYINEDGDLIYQRTPNTQVDFYLQDGDLYVEAIDG